MIGAVVPGSDPVGPIPASSNVPSVSTGGAVDFAALLQGELAAADASTPTGADVGQQPWANPDPDFDVTQSTIAAPAASSRPRPKDPTEIDEALLALIASVPNVVLSNQVSLPPQSQASPPEPNPNRTVDLPANVSQLSNQIAADVSSVAAQISGTAGPIPLQIVGGVSPDARQAAAPTDSGPQTLPPAVPAETPAIVDALVSSAEQSVNDAGPAPAAPGAGKDLQSGAPANSGPSRALTLDVMTDVSSHLAQSKPPQGVQLSDVQSQLQELLARTFGGEVKVSAAPKPTTPEAPLETPAAPTPVTNHENQLIRAVAQALLDARGEGDNAPPPSTASTIARAFARAGETEVAKSLLPTPHSGEPGAATAGVALVQSSLASYSPELVGAADLAATAAPIDDEAFEQQIVQAIRLQWQSGLGEATIKLQPPELGSMTVSLKVEGGAVSADVRVETTTAQQWIAGHELDLRSGLERHGLTLERMTVSQDAQQLRQFQQQQQQQQQQRYAAPSPRRRRQVDPREFAMPENLPV
jgi:flagellar hook-length control protein FliK